MASIREACNCSLPDLDKMRAKCYIFGVYFWRWCQPARVGGRI